MSIKIRRFISILIMMAMIVNYITPITVQAAPESGDKYFTDRLYVPEPTLTVDIGTKIDLNPNKSTLGSGWAIDKYDWQIFPPIDPKNGFEYIKDSKLADTKTTSFIADEPGVWRVYLNVADNYTVRYPDGTLENWSDKGN